MKIACIVSLYLLSTFGFSQQILKKDTTKRESRIQYRGEDNRVSFSALTPPLQQIQGAPQAFYTYYWEFGDGHYSTDPAPVHVYKKEGEHTAQLWTTNNYDNGKPPPSRPQKISVRKITYNDDKISPLPVIPDGLQLKNNREPAPDEEMVVIVSYQNDNDYTTRGKLYLFYNEKKFKADNFVLSDVRTHNGEKQVNELDGALSFLTFHDDNSMLAYNSSFVPYDFSVKEKRGPQLSLDLELKATKEHYNDFHVLEFDSMLAHESRNIFFSFKTTPEMLKDTSARVTIKSIYVPERGVDKHKSKELEMEIVTSHDPNKMSISDTRLNYRFYKNKDLDFKVRFQNNGEGAAHSIKLNVDVPDIYDKHSLKVSDMYPACPICPKGEEVTYSCLDTLLLKDKIVFHFKNIYLPGSNQKNIGDRDSTKGFVKYTLHFNKKITKKKSISRTAIIFDKNDPVLTNYTTTRFKPGLSIGAKAGTNVFPTLKDSKNYFIGVTISPYKSQRGYLQAELMAGTHTYYDSAKIVKSTPNTNYTKVDTTFKRSNYDNVVIHLVPVSYRYNINKFIGFGGGIQLGANLSGKKREDTLTETTLYPLKQNNGQVPVTEVIRTPGVEVKNTFSNFNTALFADITIGSSRIGPTAGARYVYNFNAPHEQWQFYVLWKF